MSSGDSPRESNDMEKLLLMGPSRFWRGPVRALDVVWIGVETVVGRGADRSALRARRTRAYPRSAFRGSGALAFEDRARLLRVVDDKRERRRIAPSAEEQVAIDVDAGIRQLARKAGHPTRP